MTAPQASQHCAISVIVPLHNERDNLRPLFAKTAAALTPLGRDFEIIFVNDGSNDDSVFVLGELWQEHDCVAVIDLFRKHGKAAALGHGFEIASGEILVVIDADLQYDPADIPLLIDKLERQFDIVSAQRTQRGDSGSVVATSMIFNFLMRVLTGYKYRDLFSGLKCYRREVLKFMGLYGDLYRVAMVFAAQNGFRVGEVPVRHYPRLHGVTKYSLWGRFRRAALDLAVVAVHLVFSQARLYYMGLIAWLLLGLGLIGAYWSWLQGQPWLDLSLGLSVVALELLIVKKIADSIFRQHGEEHLRQKKNIERIQARRRQF